MINIGFISKKGFILLRIDWFSTLFVNLLHREENIFGSLIIFALQYYFLKDIYFPKTRPSSRYSDLSR